VFIQIFRGFRGLPNCKKKILMKMQDKNGTIVIN